MKKIQLIAMFLVSLMLCYSAGLHAEDIDIYVSNSTNVGVPNVMFVLYNGADMDADTSNTCTYADGSTPSVGSTKIVGLLQCALVNAIGGLANGSVNIGIAVNNAGGFVGQSQATTDTTKGGYHDLCNASGNGGCIIRKLMNMDVAGKASMTAFIKGLQPFNGGGTDANGINLKVNTASADPASAMQEVWAYYNGKTGQSGTNYSTSILANGCQRNFIIYIGTSAKGVPTSAGQAGITASQVGATTAQLSPITGTVKFNPNICSQPTASLISGNDWADEWARLMYQQDGGAVGNFGTQNITTYTVNVEANSCYSGVTFPGMLSSMAKNGGGKFFDASSVTDLQSAFDTILNEVQAVNSVFSSASLPVSVNAQGTYLNQIFLGMFRPDASASPRWLGNLKQFQLVKDTSGNLVLGDSNGVSAISSSGTGFIAPGSVSYWTVKNTATLPDSLGGFFVNNPEGTPVSGYDSADGEIVEKGGAAQQFRTENLTATFVGASNTASTNPRRLYTYCPTGTSCVGDLTNSANDFSTANSGIGSAAFGSTSLVNVSSITRSGTTATATTTSAHGFSSGTSITLSNTTYYDGTYTIAVTGPTTFTFTTNDYPNSPSQNAYTVATATGAPVSIASITRTPNAASTADIETATISTAPIAHGFTTASNLQVSGASPTDYQFSGSPTGTTATTVTYNVAITPKASSANTYTVTYPTVNASLSSGSTQGQVTVTTTANLNVRAGQTFTVAGGGSSKYNGTFTVANSPAPSNSSSGSTFTGTGGSNALKNLSASTGTVTTDTSQTVAAGNINRTGTTDSSLATVQSATTGYFGSNVGDTATVLITKSSGTGTTEGAYVQQAGVQITCITSGCTKFTYPITVSPTSTVTLTNAVIGPPGGASVTIAAGKISRSISTATVDLTGSGATSTTFTNGQQVLISQTGTLNSSNESAYRGTWTISCGTSCLTFNISNVPLTPPLSLSVAGMKAYSATTPPDRDTVIKWLRGQDNYGDELGPGSPVTVRPSIHADVLHSRPFVINYGGASDEIVVYYGTNDGVFHAVNGNQKAAIGGIPAGDELWGLVLPEHFGYINRQRVATPQLKFPTTTVPGAMTKDYFVDGPAGAYQKLNSDGSINTAYLFLTMRRGGRFIYALDVSNPTTPKILWKTDTTVLGLSELGQTWSRPRLTLLQSSMYKTTPVLVFGAGYDPAEDSEPPGTDTSGRGIFIVNAATGALIWSATPTCTTSATCLQVPSMTYAIPSDVTFVDRDGDGYTDKIYVGDLGGNVWRVDVADASTTNWKVTKIAALGCDAGVCPSGTTPRKFFFPPTVLSLKAAGAVGSSDYISVVSGDREHPLKSTAAGSSYGVADKFFMVVDQTTAVNPSTYLTSGLTLSPNLFNATSTQWDGSLNGFYISFGTGEKGVNAPLAVNGSIFFSTNQPAVPSATCVPNLGTARAYAVSPFTGQETNNVLSGGGLPPSPVAGLVSITTGTGASATTAEERFCIGCGLATPPGASGTPTCSGNAALQNCTPATVIPANLKRTYWYKK